MTSCLNKYVYGLVLTWLFSLTALAWSLAAAVTNLVQIMYVIVIALLIVTILTNIFAAIALAMSSFTRYWQTGFPFLLAMLSIGVGLVKSTPTAEALVTGLLGFAVGFMIATFVLDRSWLRFVPAVTVLGLLVGGEATVVAPAIRAAALFLGSGLTVAATIRMRAAKRDCG